LIHPVQKADIFRYLVIHKYGGVYADLDTTCEKPLKKILTYAPIIVGYEMGEPTMYKERNLDKQILQWFFAAEPGKDLFILILNEIQRRSNNLHELKNDKRYTGGSTELTLWLTGPWVFSDVTHAYFKKHKNEVKIFGDCVFGCFQKQTNSIVKHHFEGSWKPGWSK
jgi:mannosyltransferase OCH1-like enzyme